jgi:hypothetical protein
MAKNYRPQRQKSTANPQPFLHLMGSRRRDRLIIGTLSAAR